MNKSYILLSIVTATGIIIFNSNYSPVLAQFRGQDSQQFFDRGNQIIEQQIQQIQQENQQQLEIKTEAKEEKIESQLEVNTPEKDTVEETPSLDNKMDDNVPQSPQTEIKIEQN